MIAPTYLASGGELQALSGLPLESAIRGVPTERLVARLRAERSLFEGDVLAKDPATPWLTIVVLAKNAGDAALSETLSSLALQSCPNVRSVVVPIPEVDLVNLRQFVARLPLRPKICDVWPDLGGENRRNLRKARYITFLYQGDILHPSAAAWLACHAGSTSEGMVDVVAWGELQPTADGGVAWAQRNPAIQRVTLLHHPYLRNAFAVSSRFVAAYPGDIVAELQGNSLHLFQIWLAHQGTPRWLAHPEYFLIRAPDRVDQTPARAARLAYAGQEASYARLMGEVAGDLVLTKHAEDSAAPYKLTPEAPPAVVSVIILFRDKAELTLRAVASVAKQSYKGFLEVILVNNQSTKECVESIRTMLSKAAGAISSWRIIDYDNPFNHSRQCNLGVQASLGDVIVFLNNDCEFISLDAVAEMSSWAMRPGVGSVGVCIRDPSTGKEASGMESRFGPTEHFESIVEERSDASLTPFVRECFGNTFACAAVPRAALDLAGGLDEIRFPNGYNDVDFACRTRALGLHHVSLGHLQAVHSPGQSRDRTDESPQKIMLRALYPDAVGGLGELVFDHRLQGIAERRAKRDRRPATPAPASREAV